jgi:hypothetical protein
VGKEVALQIKDKISAPNQNMNPQEYDQAVKDYHKDVKERPEEYKAFLEYQGYTL